MSTHPARRWVAGGVVVALILPLVVLAIRSDGYHATKVNLNDAGIWVVNWSRGVAGRINTQTGSLEVAVPAPTESFDIAQADDAVLLNVPDQDAIVPIDVALAQVREAVPVPSEGQAYLGGATGAVTDPTSGKVWSTARGELAAIDLETAAPRFEAGADAVTAVGTDGTTYAYAPGTTEIHVATADGEPGTIATPPIAEGPQISAVGGQVVLLDPSARRLLIPDHAAIDLSAHGEGPRLQQPGPGRDEVLVGTDDALLAVSISSGAVREVADGGSGGASEPVWQDGCAFGAWTATPRYVQVCDGRDPLSADVQEATPGGTLRFRVNRNRVVLNDSKTGTNVLFTDDEPKLVVNWDDALNKDRKDEESQEEVTERKETTCDADTTAAELAPDKAGTRPGRPVVVRVLDNDQFPRCEVPVVTLPDPLDPAVGTAQVIRDGTAIQVTPAPDRTTSITFDYEVAGQSGTARAGVTVDVAVAGVNSPPVAVDDSTSVVAGKAVRHDVLANDSDPEGDALTLSSARADDGVLTFRASGEISYTSSSSAIGTRNVTYTVEDEAGETDEGILEVTVTAESVNVAPQARNDRATAYVGRDTTVALLANDSDANGDALQITAVEEVGGLETDWNDRGELRVHPTQAQAFFLTYTITDGEKTADAQVRIDAVDAVANREPIAVRDDLAVRPGIPSYADLVANDIDPDGDLLAVVSLATPADSGLTVELLDKHIVRVTAPAGFEATVTVPYDVSDGARTAHGVLVVRPFRSTGPDQPPSVGDDEITVRAGAITGIGVLENDQDPEGERLTLTDVAPLPDDGSQGRIFVEADELRYAAPAEAPITVRVAYTVEDPGGNRADGHVTIRINPVDHPNQPPRAPQLEARVYAGEETLVPVPVLSLDPDGDQVAVIGVSEPPTKGHAVPVPSGLSYRADRGAAGTDSFTFKLRDSLGAEATGTVRVAIVAKPATNSSPVAVPDRKSGKAGTSLPIAVLANDSDPDGDQIALLTDGKDGPTKPRVGEVHVDGDGTGLIFDIPAGVDPGDVSFSYGITDGRGGSGRGIVTVTIEAADVPNKAPLARDDFAVLQAPGASVEVDVLANDVDPDGDHDAMKVAIVSGGSTATVGADGKVRIDVADRSVSLVYEITDEGGATARAVVSVPVIADRPPVCDTRTVDVKAGDSVSVAVLDGCRDPGGATLEVVRVLAERGGTARLDGAGIVFTAAAEVLGDAGFSFLVSNGTTTAYGGVIVRVSGQDFPPEFSRTSVELPAGGTRSVDLAALVTDLNEEDEHTFSDLQGATGQIEATLTGASVQVRAKDDAKGATTMLALKISDGTNIVDGQISVQVLAHDGQPPVAVDDTYETFQEKPKTLDVTSNDIDPLGQDLTVTVLATTGGSAEVEGTKAIRFTPTGGFFGEATVTYEILDGAKDSERSSRATARISVIGFPSKPPAPTGKRESRLVRLEWGAAQPNGSPVTEYVIENDQGVRKTSSSNSVVFDGLINGTSYRFKVAARNKAIENDAQLVWSDLSPVLMPNVVPGTPASPRLTFGDRSIAVAWTAVIPEGTAITDYELRISGRMADGSSTATRPMGTATSMTWTGLINGQSYVFSVRAKNEAGWGEWSAVTSDPVNSIPATVPGPVPSIAAQRLDKDTTLGGWITVGWGTPVDNGDAAFTFVVTTSPADVAPITVPDAATRSIEIGGLKNGVSYTFSVVASNKAGKGPSSSSPTAVPAARPGTIATVTATVDNTTGSNRAVLTFASPPDNGAAIDDWQYSNNGGPWTSVTTSGSGASMSAVVAGNNGVSSTYRLQACNVVGCANPTTAAPAVVPYGPASPPQGLSGSGDTGGNLTWNWSAPADDGGRPIVGYALWLNGTLINGNYGGTSYSTNVGRGQTRTLTVAAVNNAGLQGAQAAASASTPPPPSIDLSWGASASVSGCATNCNWLHVSLQNFNPGGSYTITCHSSIGDDGFVDRTVTADGGGQWQGDMNPYCAGGHRVTFTVDAGGVTSNQLYRP